MILYLAVYFRRFYKHIQRPRWCLFICHCHFTSFSTFLHWKFSLFDFFIFNYQEESVFWQLFHHDNKVEITFWTDLIQKYQIFLMRRLWILFLLMYIDIEFQMSVLRIIKCEERDVGLGLHPRFHWQYTGQILCCSQNELCLGINHCYQVNFLTVKKGSVCIFQCILETLSSEFSVRQS